MILPIATAAGVVAGVASVIHYVTHNGTIPNGIASYLFNVAAQEPPSPKYTYPTAFTRDIMPKIGHQMFALTQERTLASLYIDPLVQILTMQNPNSSNLSSVDAGSPHGVFDTNAEQTLNLLIDYKTNGTELHPYILKALEPLRSRGWLTTYNATSNLTVIGPITAIGTGNTPLAGVLAQTPIRDLFIDAPLSNLTEFPYDATVGPLASTSLQAAIGWTGFQDPTSEQMSNLTSQIKLAQLKGMKTRYWETPTWPIYVRNKVWSQLASIGVDYTNADDVYAASEL